MTVGFLRRFVPFVEDGSKFHTIRARAFRVGQRLDLYADSRQKTMRLIRRNPCVQAEPFRITHTPNAVVDARSAGCPPGGSRIPFARREARSA